MLLKGPVVLVSWVLGDKLSVYTSQMSNMFNETLYFIINKSVFIDMNSNSDVNFD